MRILSSLICRMQHVGLSPQPIGAMATLYGAASVPHACTIRGPDTVLSGNASAGANAWADPEAMMELLFAMLKSWGMSNVYIHIGIFCQLPCNHWAIWLMMANAGKRLCNCASEGVGL